eukprot:COSAG02_NODE_809_length_16922_cov_11.295013_3_plen_191_part_00
MWVKGLRTVLRFDAVDSMGAQIDWGSVSAKAASCLPAYGGMRGSSPAARRHSEQRIADRSECVRFSDSLGYTIADTRPTNLNPPKGVVVSLLSSGDGVLTVTRQVDAGALRVPARSGTLVTEHCLRTAVATECPGGRAAGERAAAGAPCTAALGSGARRWHARIASAGHAATVADAARPVYRMQIVSSKL